MGLSWIAVSDLGKARQFFTEVVGLKEVSVQEEFHWAEMQGTEGGALLGLGQSGGQHPPAPGQNAVVTLTVDDIVATKADMEAQGVTFLGDIMEVPGQVKLAMFQDPDGNLFHLVQMIGG
jgi:predicted enzyme related to lactoylglutathione lyase